MAPLPAARIPWPWPLPRRHGLAALLAAVATLGAAVGARAVAAPAVTTTGADARAPEAPAAAADSSFSQQVQARVPEANRCYRAALETQPALAGRLVVHFTVTPRGTVSNAVIKDSTLHSPKVESCIRDAVLRWTFSATENAQDTHVAVPFDLGPELAASNVRLPAGVIARHILDQSAVGFSAERRVVVFNRCWSVAPPPAAGVPPAGDGGAPAPSRSPSGDGGAPAASAPGDPISGEGCVVVISPISPGGTTKEIPVFQVGAAPDARTRKRKETSAWTKLLPHLKGGSFVELARTEWPAQAAELVLPQLDLVLVWGKNVIRVTRRPARSASKPVPVGEVKLTAVRGKIQPIAVYAAPDQRVLVIALREAAGPPPASGSVTHFEVIDVFR